jgi:Ca-activated chloride channel homolog
VTFSPSSPPFDALAGFWARRRIDDLMSQDWLGLQQGAMKPALKEQITQLGLDYRLMTQFTSFVAVEDRIVTKDGKPQRMEVPVEMPEGVSYEGVFGDQKQYDAFASGAGSGGRVSSALIGGVVGGVVSRNLSTPAAPPPPYQSGATKTVEVQATAPAVNTETTITTMHKRAAPTPKTKESDERAALTNTAPVRDKQRQLLESKFQPAVLAALDCARKNAGFCANVHAGKIALEIWLAEDSPAVRANLKALGFELHTHHDRGKVLTGTLAVDKLETLAKLTAIQFVSLPRR